MDKARDPPKVRTGRKGEFGLRTAHAFARDVLWGVATMMALYELVALLLR